MRLPLRFQALKEIVEFPARGAVLFKRSCAIRIAARSIIVDGEIEVPKFPDFVFVPSCTRGSPHHRVEAKCFAQIAM